MKTLRFSNESALLKNVKSWPCPLQDEIPGLPKHHWMVSINLLLDCLWVCSISFPRSTPVCGVFFFQDERVQIITHVRSGKENRHTPGATQGSFTNAHYNVNCTSYIFMIEAHTVIGPLTITCQVTYPLFPTIKFRTLKPLHFSFSHWICCLFPLIRLRSCAACTSL